MDRNLGEALRRIADNPTHHRTRQLREHATQGIDGVSRAGVGEAGKQSGKRLGSIEVREIDADTYLTAWVGERDPALFPHETRVLRAISARYSAHDFVGNPNVLRWLLGREPTRFEDYVRRQWTAYRREQR